jgi:hypothetical protein
MDHNIFCTAIQESSSGAVVIKEIQARAKGESGLKLGALRTDRGGEFNSIKFEEY